MADRKSRKIVRSPSRKVTAAPPTKVRLIESAIELLDAHFLEEITTDMILQHSSVSRGSLYHHFEDFSDLMEQALVRKFSSHVDESIEPLTKLLQDSASGEEMLANLSNVTKAIHSPENSANRFFRARIISLAEANDRLTQRLAQEQKRLTDTITDIFTQCQNKGWMNKNFDPAVAAIFIQSYTLGRVIDDVADDKVDPDAWNNFINNMIRTTFC